MNALNIAAHVFYVIALAGFGFAIGFAVAMSIAKPTWIELKVHRGRMKTRWPKAIDAKDTKEQKEI